MLDRVKDQERTSYGELQQELKTLKTLLLSSRDAAASTGPPAIFAQLNRKPSIPAWQLAQNSTPSAPATPSAVAVTTGTSTPAEASTNGVQDSSDNETIGSEFK
jgi:hypothetical protein